MHFYGVYVFSYSLALASYFRSSKIPAKTQNSSALSAKQSNQQYQPIVDHRILLHNLQFQQKLEVSCIHPSTNDQFHQKEKYNSYQTLPRRQSY